MKNPISKEKIKQPQKSALADKLSKLGSLGEKTDKSNQKKLPKKNKTSQGVTQVGGPHDVRLFWIVWGIMVVMLGALFVRAWWIQVYRPDFYIEKGNQFITFRQTLPVQRGMILDTNGIPLAANAPLVTVIFSPYDYVDSY